MGKSQPSHRLLKIHRNYTVGEVADILGTHKNTVRSWIKAGLSTIDNKRPTLILGHELIAFLQARRARRKKRRVAIWPHANSGHRDRLLNAE
jgi:hypothetical protein